MGQSVSTEIWLDRMLVVTTYCAVVCGMAGKKTTLPPFKALLAFWAAATHERHVEAVVSGRDVVDPQATVVLAF